MRVTSRTTRAELAEIVEGLDLDVDVFQNVLNQLRRLSEGTWKDGYMTPTQRRQRVIELVQSYLGI